VIAGTGHRHQGCWRARVSHSDFVTKVCTTPSAETACEGKKSCCIVLRNFYREKSSVLLHICIHVLFTDMKIVFV
jgi:hypothetical protein